MLSFPRRRPCPPPGHTVASCDFRQAVLGRPATTSEQGQNYLSTAFGVVDQDIVEQPAGKLCLGGVALTCNLLRSYVRIVMFDIIDCMMKKY